MPGQLRRADPAHHNVRGDEQPALGHHGQADGPADAGDLPHRLPVRAPEPLEQVVFARDGHPGRIGDQGGQLDDLDDDAGDGRAAHAQLGRAQVAKDQHPVQRQVQRQTGQRHPHHHLRPLQRGQIGGQRQLAQHHRQPPARDAQVILRQRRHGGRLAQGQQDRFGPPHQRHDRQRESRRQPQRHAGTAADLGLSAGGDMGGDQAQDADAESHAQKEQDVEEAGGDDQGGQRLDPVPADHHRVAHADGHARQMAADQRQAQRQGRKNMGAVLRVHAPAISARAKRGKGPHCTSCRNPDACRPPVHLR